jgi:hypothetical protein
MTNDPDGPRVPEGAGESATDDDERPLENPGDPEDPAEEPAGTQEGETSPPNPTPPDSEAPSG